MATNRIVNPPTDRKFRETFEFDCGWISGFFDAEGCIYLTGHFGPFCEMCAGVAEPELASSCSNRLIRLGIAHTRRQSARRPPRKPVHLVRIRRLESITLFALRCGFLSVEKSRRLEVVRRYARSRLPLMPDDGRPIRSRNFIRGWINGFFHGDGSAYANRGDRSVSFHSTDRRLAKRIRSFLAGEDIASEIQVQRKPNPKWQPLYSVRVRRRADISKVVQLLRPASPNRMRQLSCIETSLRDYTLSKKAQRLPQSILPHHAQDVETMRHAGATIRKIGQVFGVSHQSVHLFLQHRKTHGPSA